MKYLTAFGLTLLLLVSLAAFNTIYPVLPDLANITNSLADNVARNWRGFLFDHQNKKAPPVVASGFDQAKFQALVQAEVDRILAKKALTGQTGPGQGLIVAPKGSVDSADISRSFSDEVVVEPDPTGQSGVITPIFQTGAGQPYIYILTPITR